jgi:phage baseplate assembly protein W
MKPLGMNYPIEKGQQGYFEQTFESLENEKVKLKNLMRTIEGERYMQPSFGLAIYKYLFQQITPDLQKKIENDIRKKVQFWLPNLLINNLYVDIKTDVDRNRVGVEIDFSLKNNPTDYDVVTFTFEVNQST